MMSYLLCASQYSRTFEGKNSRESHYKPKDLLEYEVVILYDWALATDVGSNNHHLKMKHEAKA